MPHTPKILFLALSLIAFGTLKAQTVWPGDVSGNGVVDYKDVLYWSFARGESGDSRATITGAWAAQDLVLDNWSGVFPGNGQSFAYADCNGDGVVNDADLAVITLNYQKIVPSQPITEDAFVSGPIDLPSILSLQHVGDSLTDAGRSESLLLALNTFVGENLKLSGVGFMLSYDPTFIADGEDGKSLLDFSLEEADNEWLVGLSGTEARSFVYTNDELGLAEVVVYLEEPGSEVVGQGEIGQFTIVVEEVIFGLQAINPSGVIVLDGAFAENGPAASSGTTFYLEDATVNTAARALEAEAVRCYPNPITGEWLNVYLEPGAGQLQQLQILSLSGQVLSSVVCSGQSARLFTGNLPKQACLLKVVATDGVAMRKIMPASR